MGKCTFKLTLHKSVCNAAVFFPRSNHSVPSCLLRKCINDWKLVLKLAFTLAGFFAFGSGLGGAGLCEINTVNYTPPTKNGLKYSSKCYWWLTADNRADLLWGWKGRQKEHQIYMTNNLITFNSYEQIHILKKTYGSRSLDVYWSQTNVSRMRIFFFLHTSSFASPSAPCCWKG